MVKTSAYVMPDGGHIMSTMSPEEEYCLQDRKWWCFLLSSFFMFLMGIAIVLIYRFINKGLSLKKNSVSKNKDKTKIVSNNKLTKKSKYFKYWQNLENHSRKLMSCQTTSGKIIITTVFILTIISFNVYYNDANRTGQMGDSVEKCQMFGDNINAQIDLVLNICFLMYFLIRLIASTDKLWFMFEIYSIVDFLTIPPSFVPIYLDRTWIGFRCVRALMFILLPDVLRHLRFIKCSTTIHFVAFVSKLGSFMLTIAGFIHLIENSGDPFEFKNGHPTSYHECIYFIIFTTSQIGVGEAVVFRITTDLGRRLFFTLNLILIILILWYIKEILVKLQIWQTKYSQSFKYPEKSHVIVSGYLTSDNMKAFLNEFFQKNREQEVVILDTKSPNSELEDMIHQFSNVKFFKGSLLDSDDMKRIKADRADTCLLFANKYSNDPDSEDANNIMRVMAIKNYCKDIRVIVQVMQSHNKYYLLQNPLWNRRKGDEMICLSEIKFGFMGQSCLAQGFSTLLANLISFRALKSTKNEFLWQKDYTKGIQMGIFSGYLSPSFDDMSYTQTAELCFIKFKLLLLAVQEVNDNNDKNDILINPKDSYRITKRTKGYFIAKNKEMVKRAFWFCLKCHNDINDEKMIKKCNCSKIEDLTKKKFIQETGFDSEETFEEINLLTINSCKADKRDESLEININKKKKKKEKKEKKEKKRKVSSSSSSSSSTSVDSNKKIDEFKDEVINNYDSTGMFHWCPEKAINECILDANGSQLSSLSNHVIVGIFADKDSPLIGLKNILMPIRTSNIDYKDLKTVLIVGNIDYIQREWKALQNMPKISLYKGSLLSRDDLKAINLIVCDMCLILSSNTSSGEDMITSDKEALLASVNVKTFTFNDSFLGKIGQKLPKLKTQLESFNTIPQLNLQRKGSNYGVNVPLITELMYENNIKHLLNNCEDNYDIEYYRKLSFASGRVFTTSLIDSLMSYTYFNSDITSLIKTLISGGLDSDSELILSETIGLKTGDLNTVTTKDRDRCHVSHISLTGPFAHFREAQYIELFLKALKSYGILCFGIYRLLETQESNNTPNTRFVITNPSADFALNSNDLVFVFSPMNTTLI